MSEERLITVPDNARGFYIPQEYLDICIQERARKISKGQNKGQISTYQEQDDAAAAILRILERWTVWKMKQSSKAQPDDLWIFLSQSMLQEWELLNAYGESRIAKGCELLVERGFVERRRNPVASKRWDRTFQYRFMTDNVQEAVNNLRPYLNIKEWIVQYQGMHSSISMDRNFNIEEAIPQIPSQESAQIPEQQSSAPSGAAQVETPAKEISPFKEMQTSVVELLFNGNWTQGDRAGAIAHMLLGTSNEPAFKKYNLEKATTPNEFQRVVEAYPPDLTFPRGAAKINQAVYDYRQQPEGEAQRKTTEPSSDPEYERLTTYNPIFDTMTFEEIRAFKDNQMLENLERVLGGGAS